ncbi:hypothetical protein [Rhizobium sp. CCGE 510]|uniref:hypothetical protein n=1 Tax=Rhizobium sp. CCGE 510 TaxID=1132836 RepID=UPI00027B8B72|nr:hypothetical protein [Rhizobium sp. CCGE 510]EJT01462.1 hypothetical protein RCCGE510_29466 [Rhizobium sp. CCGE 510]
MAHADDQQRLTKAVNTFSTVNLAIQDQAWPANVKTALQQVDEVRKKRAQYYENLREASARWVHGSRRFLAISGSVAFLLTATAAAVRFFPPAAQSIEYDKWLLLCALAIYALMGAVSFYENATDRASAYFRHVTIILQMRDLWGKFQFEVFKEIPVAIGDNKDVAAASAAQARIIGLCQALSADLDKMTETEAGEWRVDFMASLSELATATKQGSTATLTGLDEQLKRAEKAAQDVTAAASRVEQALRPSHINLTLTGTFDGTVVISIDDTEVAQTSGKQIALANVRPGSRKLAARATKGTAPLEVSRMIDVAAGTQDVTLALA